MIETICFLRTWKRVRSFYATQSSFQSNFLQRRKDRRGADYVSQGGRSCNSPACPRAIRFPLLRFLQRVFRHALRLNGLPEIQIRCHGQRNRGEGERQNCREIFLRCHWQTCARGQQAHEQDLRFHLRQQRT